MATASTSSQQERQPVFIISSTGATGKITKTNRTLASFKVKVAEKLNLSRDGVLSLQHDRGNGVVAPLEDDFDYHAFIQRLNVSSTPLQVKVQPLTSVSTGQPPTTTPSPIHPPPHISPALSGESKKRKRSASPPVLNAPVAQTAGDGPRANKKKKKKKKQRNSESDASHGSSLPVNGSAKHTTTSAPNEHTQKRSKQPISTIPIPDPPSFLLGPGASTTPNRAGKLISYKPANPSPLARTVDSNPMEQAAPYSATESAAELALRRKRRKRPSTNVKEPATSPVVTAAKELSTSLSTPKVQEQPVKVYASVAPGKAPGAISQQPKETESGRKMKKRKRKSETDSKGSSVHLEDVVSPTSAPIALSGESAEAENKNQHKLKKQKKQKLNSEDSATPPDVVPAPTTPNTTSANCDGHQTPTVTVKKGSSGVRPSAIALAEYRRLHPEMITPSPALRPVGVTPAPASMTTPSTSAPASVATPSMKTPRAAGKTTHATPAASTSKATPSSDSESKPRKRVTEHAPHPLPVHFISSPPSNHITSSSKSVALPQIPIISPPRVPLATPATVSSSDMGHVTNPGSISPRLVRLPSSSPEMYSSSDSEGETEYDRRVKRQGVRRSPESEDLQAIGDDDVSDAESRTDRLAVPAPILLATNEPFAQPTDDISETDVEHDDVNMEANQRGDSFEMGTQDDDIVESPHTHEDPGSHEPINEIPATRQEGKRHSLADIEIFASSGVPHNSGAVAYFEALGDDDEMCRTSSRAASESLGQDQAVSPSSDALATPGAGGPGFPSTPLRPSSGGAPQIPSSSRPSRPLDLLSQPSPTPKHRRSAVSIPVIGPTTKASQSPVAASGEADLDEDAPGTVVTSQPSTTSNSLEEVVLPPDAPAQAAEEVADFDAFATSSQSVGAMRSPHVLPDHQRTPSRIARGECCDICFAVPTHIQRKCPIIIGGCRTVVDRLEELQKDGSSPRGVESLKVWEEKLKRHVKPLAPNGTASDSAQSHDLLDDANVNAHQLVSASTPTKSTNATSPSSAGEPSPIPGVLVERAQEIIIPNGTLLHYTVLPAEQITALGSDSVDSDKSEDTDDGSSSEYNTDVESEELPAVNTSLSIARSPNSTMLKKTLLNGNSAIPSLSSLSADSLRRRRSQGSFAGSVTGRSSVGGGSRHGSESVVGDADSATNSTSESEDGVESSDDSGDEGSGDDPHQGNGRLDPSIEARMVKPSQRKTALKTKGQLIGW